MTTLLSVEGVDAFYGKIQALRNVNVEVNRGEIVTLIGSNGAGKSTLMMTIFGQPRARTGRVVFDGTDVTDLPAHLIARRGIAQAPEGRRIFPRMSVLENLQMGAGQAPEPHFEDDLGRVRTLLPRHERRQTQGG